MQNRDLKVVASVQIWVDTRSIDINHRELQGRAQLAEIQLPQPLLQALTEAATLAAEQGELKRVSRGRGHSRRE